MRILTSLTVILMLPTLLTSMYGMNVELPMKENPYAFYIIMGVSLFISVGAIVMMIKKRWI